MHCAIGQDQAQSHVLGEPGLPLTQLDIAPRAQLVLMLKVKAAIDADTEMPA